MRKRKGIALAGVEEIACRNGLIGAGQRHRLAIPPRETGYGTYLRELAATARPAEPAQQPIAELRHTA